MNLPHVSRRQVIQAAYPTLLALFAVVVLGAFIGAASSLTRELNRIFIIDTPESAFIIDEEAYAILQKKLRLPPLHSETMETPQPEEERETPTGATTEEDVTAPQAELSVAVYNATGVPGLAARLKAVVERPGIAISQIGNADPQSTNTIQIKESKRAELDTLVASLPENFNAETTTLSEDSEFDCIITIGKTWEE